MPSVLFINRVYPPDEGATGELLFQLAPALAQAGWDVTVLTTGNETGEQTAGGHARPDVCIVRERALSFPRGNHARRALSLLMLYPALLLRALLLPRADVIVVMSDPPLLVALGAILRWCTRARLIHWVQDVYPEVAEEMGVLRQGGWIARIARAVSDSSLRCCDTVVAIGECMRARLEARGAPRERLTVVPNWSPTLPVETEGEDPSAFRREQRWTDRFVVMYSGNFGLAHEFESILDAAGRLRVSHPSVMFAMAGEGPRRAWVEAEACRRGLVNMEFLPRQPWAKLAGSLRAADVHLASMRRELCGLVVPSKVYGILAAGRPCLFIGPRGSEVAALIEAHGCGEVLDGADGAVLARSLAAWASDPARVRTASSLCRGLSDALKVDVAARAFLKILEGVAGGEPCNVRPVDHRSTSSVTES